MKSPLRVALVLAGLVGCGIGCGKGAQVSAPPDSGVSVNPTPDSGVSVNPTPDSGIPVGPAVSATEAAERARVSEALKSVAGLDSAGLAGRYPTAFSANLGYDPRTAANLALIRSSRLGLTSAEEEVLVRNGFVISSRQKFPTFAYGYSSIYSDDLPLFISADSILYAVHRSYDEMLKRIEVKSLRPALRTLLGGMRSALAGGTVSALGAATAADLDVYLAVASGLLDPGTEAPVAGASADEIAGLLAKAKAAAGSQMVKIFGLNRLEDFSQFIPRGHYTESENLKTYFKAMMWLGRIDLRIIETKSDGSQTFQRRQFDGALGLSSLVTPALRPELDRLDRTIEAFVGESDNMRVPEFPALLTALKAAGPADVVALDDTTIAAAMMAGNFGVQRISSHIMINGLGKGTLPLSRTFLLLGQRYVVDSHVFSNVVYDRVQRGSSQRMMPDPLDVAFAVLGNNQAATLLAPQLNKYRYAPDLASMRVLVDDHGEGFWSANLYNEWLGAVRALSRTGAEISPPLAVAQTEAWGLRTLNTQLASWAELRHDTILYAKQSYSAGSQCEFPDALVEPNPAFFAKLREYARKGSEVLAALGTDVKTTTSLDGTMEFGQSGTEHFKRLGEVAAMLESMATYQAQGTPFTAEQMAFVNQTVSVQPGGCGPPTALGWYPSLFFGADPTQFSPTIADVHTMPFTETGAEVGRVLHVGTGYARLMVLTANTCTGPRAYAGLVSSYFEQTQDNYKRLDDPTWQQQLMKGPAPAETPWLSGLIAPQ